MPTAELKDFTQIINKSVEIVSKQDQIKMSVSVKNVVAVAFMCPIIKIFHLCSIVHFVMYENGNIVKN